MFVIEWLLTIVTLFVGIGLGLLISDTKKQQLQAAVKKRLTKTPPVGGVKKPPPYEQHKAQIVKDTEAAMTDLIETKILPRADNE